MKKIYLLATILLGLSAQLMAQAPQGINYQAVIRNPNGTTVNNSNISLQMRILQGSASGTAVYVETFTETTSNIGLVNIVIGTGTVVAGDFTTIDWGNGPYFMEVGADTGGGTGYIVMGTQQMMSVPYALYAENSGTPGPQGPQGIQGDPGPQGPTGATGPQGPAGATGPQGPQGVAGPQGPAGADGTDGADGLSAYEVWLSQGNTGTEADFLTSLQGADGAVGATGPQGPQGVAGPQGPAGTNGLDGTDGVDGLSAYEVWLAQGNTGTEADFLTSLQGADGAVGATGPQGPQGVAGPQGPAGADGNGIASTTDNGDGTFTFTYDDGSTQLIDLQDNDSDSTNELQNIYVSNDSLFLSQSNGIALNDINGSLNNSIITHGEWIWSPSDTFFIVPQGISSLFIEISGNKGGNGGGATGYKNGFTYQASGGGGGLGAKANFLIINIQPGDTLYMPISNINGVNGTSVSCSGCGTGCPWGCCGTPGTNGSNVDLFLNGNLLVTITGGSGGTGGCVGSAYAGSTQNGNIGNIGSINQIGYNLSLSNTSSTSSGQSLIISF